MLIDQADNTEVENSLDPLTGLPNRSFGSKQANVVCKKVGIDNVGAMIVELSQFGQINDSMGHQLADKILKLTAKRFNKLFPHVLCFFRSHGDQFCLLFERSTDIAFELERLLDFVRRPFAVQGHVVILTLKVGVAENSPDFESADELIYAAELALHKSKQSYDQITYYQASMVGQARIKHEVGNDLRVSSLNNSSELYAGQANNEFYLVYQPIVSSVKKKLVAFEALLRWQHPEKGLMMPDIFIETAEEIGTMPLLGNWVIKKACHDLRKMIDNKITPKDIGVSVNISSRQFLDSDALINTVKIALNENMLQKGQLRLEIRESAQLANVMPAVLHELKALGCSITLDDFGTGYSSIAHLTHMPLDYVKIDRSFIKQLDSNKKKTAAVSKRIAAAIYSLAQALNVSVITEGVETRQQLDIANKLNADLIQGFYYSKPLKEQDVAQFVKNFKA
ncbi:bifunctional diguanylate cyclase/phosphodiesterase [Glaciecola sp. MH2013]|uniref:putative bifunctional diguanylate cyclase/phosphodiesterase n=1 Tax=Glaciecola sp. MH2013 TaxID=2785524 RepID=UPI00189ED290|nr:bifunctional diguanylate cyclase/phosphodiesterase [Glaciecola sp. MH2013]MBF7073282.1 bifunctional diguanylate cyclase/phosphodiesterase [Glaciecola sp. MH2013]